jgi:hypothetical protein
MVYTGYHGLRARAPVLRPNVLQFHCVNHNYLNSDADLEFDKSES